MTIHESSPQPSSFSQELEAEMAREMELAFAPLHKRALGTAVGVVFGGMLFVVTAVMLIRGEAPGGDARGLLERISFLIPLYEVSWSGAVFGSLSAAFAFFCAGWFLAFARNLVLAVSIWILRTRAELSQTQDFLDHI